ncbi:MAG: PEP/pyruvate-binding domain-containing protein [Bacteroidota bacterium]
MACPEHLGGKAANLMRLRTAGFPVPAFFTVPADAENVEAAVADGLRQIGAVEERVAVRSSARDEDGTGASFAGQLDSFLHVAPADIAARVADVRASGQSDHVQAYRAAQGLNESSAVPAVLVQRMVAADAAGVLFTADPSTGRRGVAVVSAGLGLAEALVQGEAPADTFRIDRNGNILERHVVAKPARYALDGGSVRAVPVSNDLAEQPALSDAQLVALAQLGRRIERQFGRPQDIEWALEGGEFFIVQARPITTLAGLPDPDAVRRIWDNSNIIESYGGVTTPLTFSFARRAYASVYRLFARLMRVPEATIEQNDAVFDSMIGLADGRIYYSLRSWYAVLAMLPGFETNRSFMEQMMGVKEPLPDDMLDGVSEHPQAGFLANLRGRAALLGTALGLVWNHLTLPRKVDAFYDRLDETLQPPAVPLDQMRPDELAAYYRFVERELLTQWDAPLVNDFFAMIFYGLLRRIAETWAGDPDGRLANGLLAAQGEVISAEPARLLGELADHVRNDEEATAALNQADPTAVRQLLRERPDLATAIEAYLDRFGDRCMEELKLESPTLRDQPAMLWRSIARLASVPAFDTTPHDTRAEAERQFQAALGKNPIRRLVANWILKHARARVQGRENLRFERTRVFGLARRIFRAFGRQLYALDQLDQPDDVFYLTVDELLDVEAGRAVTANLSGLVALRRSEFDAYRNAAAPPDRFETRGIPYFGRLPETQAVPSEPASGDERTGLGGCPGRVRGIVRVVRDPRTETIEAGEILVAEHTDPGWILLFPGSAGVLVERGSLLSHAAIVSRELGIPSVVGIPGLTRWLQTGDEVEFDGSTGRVWLVG